MLLLYADADENGSLVECCMCGIGEAGYDSYEVDPIDVALCIVAGLSSGGKGETLILS